MSSPDERADILTSEAQCVRVQLLDAVAALEDFIARLDAEVARHRADTPPPGQEDST